MVVFTCNHCGDTLQKPKVAKHYQFKCRKAAFVTCVDCLKDFREEEYIVHTKCITEAERYGGKNYVAKLGANKGERKQQEWICIVNNLLNGIVDLSNAEKEFLNILSKFENIPRKKAKFFNFVKNAIGNRINMTVVESVWVKMETAYRQTQQSVTQESNHKTKEINPTIDSSNLLSIDHEENTVDNQNNENICREYNSVESNGNNEAYETNMNNTQTVTEKKCKKRRLTESQEQLASTKIKKASAFLESSTCRNENNKIAFNWKLAILDIVQNKGEISLKKLQKKIISLYSLQSTKNVEYEKIVAKFHKKLNKISQVIVTENIVKLVNQQG